MENKHGLTAQFAYTYAHQIDEQTDDLTGASDPFNLRYDRASGGYDRRHNFEANYVYNIPLFIMQTVLRSGASRRLGLLGCNNL